MEEWLPASAAASTPAPVATKTSKEVSTLRLTCPYWQGRELTKGAEPNDTQVLTIGSRYRLKATNHIQNNKLELKITDEVGKEQYVCEGRAMVEIKDQTQNITYKPAEHSTTSLNCNVWMGAQAVDGKPIEAKQITHVLPKEAETELIFDRSGTNIDLRVAGRGKVYYECSVSTTSKD